MDSVLFEFKMTTARTPPSRTPYHIFINMEIDRIPISYTSVVLHFGFGIAILKTYGYIFKSDSHNDKIYIFTNKTSRHTLKSGGQFIQQYLHFIAIALEESIFLDVLHFPMKNIKSRDLDATPMGGATSKPSSNVDCWCAVGRVSS